MAQRKSLKWKVGSFFVDCWTFKPKVYTDIDEARSACEEGEHVFEVNFAEEFRRGEDTTLLKEQI
jgi:hypothetical protein